LAPCGFCTAAAVGASNPRTPKARRAIKAGKVTVKYLDKEVSPEYGISLILGWGTQSRQLPPADSDVGPRDTSFWVTAGTGEKVPAVCKGFLFAASAGNYMGSSLSGLEASKSAENEELADPKRMANGLHIAEVTGLGRLPFPELET
jgi:hypothetical protein